MSGNLKSQKPNDWQNSWNAKTSERFKCPSCKLFFQKIQIQGWKQEFRQRREQTSNYFAARAHQVLRGGKEKTVTHTKCGLLSSSGFSWLQGQIEFVIWPRSRLTETQQDHGFVSQTLVFRTESNKPHYNCTISKEVANQFIIESIWRLSTKKLF